jgi:uncharacterized protein (TIRG00374 family)
MDIKTMKTLQIERILEQAPPSHWRVISHWVMGLLCLGVVLFFTFHIGELEQFIHVIQNIQAEWVVLAAFIQMCSYASAAGVWYLVLKYSGHQIRFRSIYPLSIAQLFAEQALPSNGISGAIIVVKGLLRRGLKEADGMACMLVGMISYYIAYFIAILASLLILYLRNATNGWLTAAAAIFCIAAILFSAGILHLRHLEKHHRLPEFISKRTYVSGLLRIIAEAPIEILKQPALIAMTASLQISVFMIDAITLNVMLQAIGYAQSYDIVFASFVMASVVGALLPIPLGLGSFEGTCAGVLHLFGVPLEAALIAALLLRGFTSWLPMIPGLWLVRRELK